MLFDRGMAMGKLGAVLIHTASPISRCASDIEITVHP